MSSETKTGKIVSIASEVASTASITSLPSDTSFVRLTGVTATTIHGIAAGTDGQMLVLYNPTGAILTLKNLSGTAPSADQITTSTLADILSTFDSAHMFIYDGASAKWVVLGGIL